MDDDTCTPRWWPHHIGDTYRCDQCGHQWVCDTADHMGCEDTIAAGLLDPLTLGWRTA